MSSGEFYHVYWDQGGAFGESKMTISKEKLCCLDCDEEDLTDIRNYYVGYISHFWIEGMLQMFLKAYKQSTTVSKIGA